MKNEKIISYLALGDSYTIGEGVLLFKSFPYLTVQILRKVGITINAPEIIAKTGWTTDELISGINNHTLLSQYNFVTLLIGVNNQYRERLLEEYKSEFEVLLKRALTLVNKKDHVIVLSIPDYSVTPFALTKDKNKITKEIELFNSVNKALSIQYKVQYVDITDVSRNAFYDETLIASDGLHPSEKQYEKWAIKVAELIQNGLN